MDSVSLDTVNMNSMHFLLLLNIPYSKTLIKSKAKLEMRTVKCIFTKNEHSLPLLKKVLILAKGLCKILSTKSIFRKVFSVCFLPSIV